MKRFIWFLRFWVMSSFDQRRMLLVQRWGWMVIITWFGKPPFSTAPMMPLVVW
ncbi:MAG: hypothetical protein ACOYNC_18490 [Bacteroidales bacterium]